MIKVIHFIVDCNEPEELMLVLPKNSGLKSYTDKFLDSNPLYADCKMLKVRGEDVPFWVSQLTKKGKRAIGFTGEDLFQDYRLRNDDASVKVLGKIEWKDASAMYGKPALCFIGPIGKKEQPLPAKFTICACGKYKGIVKDFLKKYRDSGHEVDEIYVNGSVEASCSEGIADVIVDIVYSGRSIDEFGLEIYDVIFKSDCVILGGTDD